MKWEIEVLPEVKIILKEFDGLGIKPTLRTVFYSLVSRNMLENRLGHYKSLSKYTVIWRERSLPSNIGKYREDEILPMDCFVDETRQILDINDIFETPEEYIEKGISYLRYAPEDYKVPRWYKQPNYVEVWIEKGAMAGTLESILEDSHIRIAPLKGFSGIDFLYRNVQRLIEKQKMGKSIHILYCGDYDPSGLVMDDSIDEKLSMYGLHDYHFERISITKEQIEDFKLPRSYKKIKGNNTHVKSFRKKNNGEAFQIELDAMQAFHPEEFKAMILKLVNSLFDEEIYQKMLESIPNEAEIVRLVRKQMQELSEEFEKEE